jgi:hypothetical protein
MKTSELIAQLREADPSGEIEVFSGSCPVYGVENLPAYYDGPAQSLIRNSNNIKGIKLRISGRKIKLHTIDYEVILWDTPDAEIDLSELGEAARKEWSNLIEQTKEQIARINQDH